MQQPDFADTFATELRRRWFRAMRTDKYIRTKGVYGAPGQSMHCALGALRDEAIHMCAEHNIPYLGPDNRDTIHAAVTMAGVDWERARLIEIINDSASHQLDAGEIRPFSAMVHEFLREMSPEHQAEIKADAIAA